MGYAQDSMSQIQRTSIREAARLPVVFAGHGSPMNVIEDNRWSRGFAGLRALLPVPSAIVAISAHWYLRGTFVTGDARPKTIHDFSGFPRPLYEIEYPAPGNVALAEDLCHRLGGSSVSLSLDWGLDHGTWSVLRWTFPEANVPVVQLSIDRRLTSAQHLELGRLLAELRNDGVLIFGSGNVVHNLGDAFRRMQTGSTETPPWALRFDEAVARSVTERDDELLLSLLDSEDGRLAHPTPEHFLPLLYTYGASDADDEVLMSSEAFDLGSLSMRNIVWR